MNDASFSSPASIKVQLDAAILHELIYGDGEDPPRDEKARAAWDRRCALREHQIYRLLRQMVTSLNGRMKGRRDRFKLVEEGEGLVLEFGT